jgi:hypothetical protein
MVALTHARAGPGASSSTGYHGPYRSGRRRRAVALVLLLPGGLVSDVAYASMAGRQAADGALPCNLAPGDLVHGDTYPLLACWPTYRPLIAPVRDGFDNLDGALYVAAGFALLAAFALGGGAPVGR